MTLGRGLNTPDNKRFTFSDPFGRYGVPRVEIVALGEGVWQL